MAIPNSLHNPPPYPTPQRRLRLSAGPGRAPMTTLTKRVYRFYRDGFRSMVLGRTLWKLIALKLFLIFAVLKLFFFSDFLGKNFHSDSERSAHVLDNLTRTRAP